MQWTAQVMVLRPRSPPSSPAPSAHRDAASGLDRDAAVERWAWMPSTPQSVFRGYAMIRPAVRSVPSCGDLLGLSFARRCKEFCHRLDLHVAALQLPFDGVDRSRCGSVLQVQQPKGGDTMSAPSIGLDIAQSVFQVRGVNELGRAVLRRQLGRSELLVFFAKQPACSPANA